MAKSAVRTMGTTLGREILRGVLGSVFGVLPGLGPVAALALLLPATLGLPSLPALLVLAGVSSALRFSREPVGSGVARLMASRSLSRSPVMAVEGRARMRSVSRRGLWK